MDKHIVRMGILLGIVCAGCGGQNAATTGSTLSAASAALSGFRDVGAASADLNGDGIPDLAVLSAPTDPQSTLPGFVSVYYGPIRNGSLPRVAEHFVTAPTASAITLADVNGDGIVDVVIAERIRAGDRNLGRIEILYRKADGTELGEATQLRGIDGQSVALADVDGDGTLDLIATNSSILYVARGLGGGAFDTAINFSCSGAWTVRKNPTLAGVDLVIGRWSDPNVADIIRWDGHNTPTVAATLVFSQTISALAAADLDGDGSEDLLVGTSDGMSGSLYSMLVGNQWTIRSAGITNVGMVLKIATGDFNGDGIIDVCLSGFSPDGSVICLLGTGSGAFDMGRGVTIPAAPSSFLYSADLDGDGKADLVVCGPSGSVVTTPNVFGP